MQILERKMAQLLSDDDDVVTMPYPPLNNIPATTIGPSFNAVAAQASRSPPPPHSPPPTGQLFSPTRLAALVAGLAHPSAYWHGSAVQAARDDAVAREEQRLKEARTNEASAVATLRDKCAQARTEQPGREGAERALRGREARLAAMPLALDKPAKAAVKRDFDAALAEAKAVSELAVAVSVHENMVVLTRRGTHDSGTSFCY